MRRYAKAFTVALVGVSCGASAMAATPLKNGEMGFVLTAFAPAIYQAKDDCPDGLSNTIRENFLQSLAAPERADLSRPENEKTLASRWKAWALGPNNTNICAFPERFPDRGPQKIFKGSVARGLDLDGGKPDCGGGEASFISPEGQRGIDNAAYRGLGCSRNYRGVDGTAGDIVKGSNMRLSSGEQSIVLLLRGVDSLDNDPQVEVILGSTNDRPVLDSKGNFVTGTSFTLADQPRWRNLLRGRIEKGVLMTSAAPITLDRKFGHGGQMGASAEWQFHDAQLRLAFMKDGSVKGLLGGYQTPRNIMISTISGALGAATVAGIDCAADYNTLLKFADHARDPKTGQCTQASVALDVEAVPAFVFDRPTQVAAKGTAK